jgi:hypothetical protein
MLDFPCNIEATNGVGRPHYPLSVHPVRSWAAVHFEAAEHTWPATNPISNCTFMAGSTSLSSSTSQGPSPDPGVGLETQDLHGHICVRGCRRLQVLLHLGCHIFRGHAGHQTQGDLGRCSPRDDCLHALTCWVGGHRWVGVYGWVGGWGGGCEGVGGWVPGQRY